jgi:hypothetical protein
MSQYACNYEHLHEDGSKASFRNIVFLNHLTKRIVTNIM